METIMTDDSKLRDAKKYVATLKGFYIHLTVFAAVMTGLFGLDYTDGKPWWVQWPFAAWGLGLCFHAYMVFADRRHTISDWEKRKIKEALEKN